MNKIRKYIKKIFAAIGDFPLRLPAPSLRGRAGGEAVGLFVLFLLLLASCSTHLEPGEQLFTGLKPIDYQNHDNSEHFIETQAEVEAALATAPNGALFGSSYYRTIPYALWIHNACEGKKSGFAKWMGKTFGKAPVLMGNVNPELRVSVAGQRRQIPLHVHELRRWHIPLIWDRYTLLIQSAIIISRKMR